jgi:hypothetical protein
MDLRNAPSSNLLHRDSLGSIPKSIASVLLKAILGPHGEDSKQQLGSGLGR